MDLVHKLKGKHVVYVWECEPGEDGLPYRYVGCSENIERRTCEHLGLKPGAASWTKLHPPVDVIAVKVCEMRRRRLLWKPC